MTQAHPQQQTKPANDGTTTSRTVTPPNGRARDADPERPRATPPPVPAPVATQAPKCLVRVSFSPTVATTPSRYAQLLPTLRKSLTALREVTKELVAAEPSQTRVEFRQELTLRAVTQMRPPVDRPDYGWDPIVDQAERSYVLRHVNANTIAVGDLDEILSAETDFLSEQLLLLAALRKSEPAVTVVVEVDYSRLVIVDEDAVVAAEVTYEGSAWDAVARA